MRVYRDDPVGFARDVLGVRLWKGQRDILTAIRDHSHVAIVSGHKVGKTTAFACAALWFYCTRPGGRVQLTAVTDHHVNAVMWREVQRLVKNACREGWEIPGAAEMHTVARAGLKDPATLAEIVGYTARDPEAIAGVSGADLLYLVDEASGVSDAIFEAIEGNMMGGAKLGLIGNPTRAEGEFYRAFKIPRADGTFLYARLHIASNETPNCTGTEPPIPGLADPEMIATLTAKWGGPKSTLTRVRIFGEFVIGEEGKIFPLSLLEACHSTWRDEWERRAKGQLVIGLDPAGPNGEGDDSVFAVRRGDVLIELLALRGLDEDGLSVQAIGLAEKHLLPSDNGCVFVVDGTGPVGYRVVTALRANVADRGWRVIKVRASDLAVRERQNYGTIRDELYANLRDRMVEGTALLPPDEQLDADLNAPAFTLNVKGKSEATKKNELRKLLGRSPDRGDAVCLAFWWNERAPVAAVPEPEQRPGGREAWLEEPPLGPLDGGYV